MRETISQRIYLVLYGLVIISFPTSISGMEGALGLMILALPIWRFRSRESVPTVRGFPTWLFLLLMLTPLIAALTSPDLVESMKWYRRHMFLVVIPLVMLTLPLVKKHWQAGVWGYAVVSAIASTYAVLQVYFGQGLDRPFHPKGYYVHAAGFFSKQNTFAEVLTFGFLASLFLIRHAKGKLRKTMAIVMALVIFAAIVFTRSRTPIVVSALMFIVFLLRQVSWRTGIGIVVLLLTGLTVLHLSNDRIFWRFTQVERDAGHRARIWGYAARAFAENPVTGYGLGTFQYYLLQNTTEPDRDLTKYDHAHCNILEAAQAGGLIWLIVFLTFWGRVLWDSWRMAWRETEEPWKTGFFILFLMNAAFHLEGLTECNIMDTEVVLQYYFIVGVFYWLRSNRLASAEEQTV